MKNSSVKLFTGIVIAAVLLMTGCVTEKETHKDTEIWLKEHGDEVMKYDYTKADIEADIEANWKEYGYKTKPTKYIAISFDDGPCSAPNGGTAAILEKLAELHVKATFFVIGQNVRGNKTAAQAIFNSGHELGNHSDGYGSLGGSTADAITRSLDAASLAIKEITGKYPCLFRAPNLNYGTNLYKVCEERGMPLIGGNVHNDWDGTGHTSASIKNSVLANPQDGGIILLHDNNTSKGDTLSALPDIIKGLREKDFWILTVGQLAAVKENSLEAGELYNSIN
ncbi:MAG: polysaccharide deacetylase family protein [Treponema sp.]|jgi:peptidoglycan/xylan/chitin deacetylase (PgdA/CDA1 family)|nr:polysaccharide deacetylase family protein [Treponema sp.]